MARIDKRTKCYWSDLNPIEMAFAKRMTRLGARVIRTIGGLWKTVGDICEIHAPAKCQKRFRPPDTSECTPLQ